MVSMIVLAAVLLKCAATAYACGGQILAQNFDKYSGGYQTWTKDMGKKDFDGLIFLKFDDFAEVGDGHLRVKNPQGCVGTSACAATFDVQLPPMDEATLTYRFKHSPGYVYGRGGKLPGMCAMDCPAGCADVTAESGFNSRVMWRGEDLMTYVYYAGMDPATNCGEDWHWNVATTSGQWHTIEMYIKVNTPGQADGAQTIKYNGAEVLSKTGVMWTQNYHPIEKFTFRSFHGGSGAEWASAQDQYIYFDDIKISGGKCSEGDGALPATPPPDTTAPAPVEDAGGDENADAGAEPTGDAENCGGFMAPVCTTGAPCEEGLEASTGDQFLGESICRPAGGDQQGGDDMGSGPNAEESEPQPTYEYTPVTEASSDPDSGNTGSSDGSGDGALKRLSKPSAAMMVEEDDGEPEQGKQDMGGAAATAAAAGESGLCDPPPPPGYFCSPSGREREMKDRTREPKDRTRKPKNRKMN